MVLEVNDLQTENEQLKTQLNQNSQGVQALLAQIDALKEKVNEGNYTDLQLRTNCILLQKANKELAEEISSLKLKVNELTQSLATYTFTDVS